MSYAPKAGTDDLYRQELLTIIQAKIDEHPRGAQVQLGPSEIGGCERKAAWKLAYGGNDGRPGGWAAAKGTVLHAFLDELFKNVDRLMPDGTQRFFSDMKLTPVSQVINGGTLDLYDRLNQIVVDWKCPGAGTMDKARANNLARGYYVQAQTYGYHLESMGYPVSTVALMFLPMAGDDLHSTKGGAVLRTWRYDSDVAVAAVARIERLQSMLEVAPPRKVLEISTTLSDFCQSCPAAVYNGDKRAICPGASSAGSASRSLDLEKNPFAR